MVKYHRIYTYMDPKAGIIDTFPVWKGSSKYRQQQQNNASTPSSDEQGEQQKDSSSSYYTN